MTTTVAYIRVSTDDQASTGVSLEAQKAKVQAYAELYDLDVVDVVIDAGISAKTLNRPGLQKALDMIKHGVVEAMLVVKLDRLTRSVSDLGHLVENVFQKAALLSVSEQIDTRSAAGRLVLNVLASVAQWEREAIGERTSAALQHKRSQGERVGSVPYGYCLADDGVKLEPVPAEQAVIEQARELHAAGLSLRKVADRLATLGHASRTGRQFAPSQISRMLAA